MKLLLSIMVLLYAIKASAQMDTVSTTHFSIEGRVKEKVDFDITKIQSYSTKTIDSVVILNHLKQRKHAIKNIRGILLKDVLNKAVIDAENPKALSEYYIECIATDNYKIVFSWNELFNTETGNNVLIITEKDGKSDVGSDDGIAIITSTDFATGRRYLKNLKQVLIKRVN